jgi:hypothetical protein
MWKMGNKGGKNKKKHYKLEEVLVVTQIGTPTGKGGHPYICWTPQGCRKS